MKKVIKHTITLAALAVCCVQAAPTAIQKLKKVSKPDDGKEWTVTIYKVDQNGEQGKRVSQSKFKKDTDGLLTKKLHFDFTATPLNKIVIIGAEKPCEILIPEFKAAKNQTATLNADCTITFTPKTSLKSLPSSFLQLQRNIPGDNRAQRLIEVQVPSAETWTIMSSDNFSKAILQSPNAEKYILDSISITSTSKPNDRLLKIYTEEPSAIAVKKEDDPFKITRLKKSDLINKLDRGFIVIDPSGSAEIVRTKKASPTVSTATEAPALTIHGMNPGNLE